MKLRQNISITDVKHSKNTGTENVTESNVAYKSGKVSVTRRKQETNKRQTDRPKRHTRLKESAPACYLFLYNLLKWVDCARFGG